MDATEFASSRTEAGQGRSVTPGDNDLLLYRNQSGSPSFPAGAVSFDLQQSHARFTAASGDRLPASVQSGSLAINFGSNAFQTALSLSSVPTGNVGLQASGAINSEGFFVSRNANQAVAGALAFDGKSAAYLFEKAAAGGTLSGITLWSR